MKYLELGSVSSGTMLARDLIPAFIDALESVDEVAAAGFDDRLMGGEPGPFPEWCETATAEVLLDDLFDALNGHCPSYCYFGANEGDGAD